MDVSLKRRCTDSVHIVKNINCGNSRSKGGGPTIFQIVGLMLGAVAFSFFLIALGAVLGVWKFSPGGACCEAAPAFECCDFDFDFNFDEDDPPPEDGAGSPELDS